MGNSADRFMWRTTYESTVEALEVIRAKELHALTDEEALRILRSLETPGPIWREDPAWSGLVEQQALFQRIRQR